MVLSLIMVPYQNYLRYSTAQLVVLLYGTFLPTPTPLCGSTVRSTAPANLLVLLSCLSTVTIPLPSSYYSTASTKARCSKRNSDPHDTTNDVHHQVVHCLYFDKSCNDSIISIHPYRIYRQTLRIFKDISDYHNSFKKCSWIQAWNQDSQMWTLSRAGIGSWYG